MQSKFNARLVWPRVWHICDRCHCTDSKATTARRPCTTCGHKYPKQLIKGWIAGDEVRL